MRAENRHESGGNESVDRRQLFGGGFPKAFWGLWPLILLFPWAWPTSQSWDSRSGAYAVGVGGPR